MRPTTICGIVASAYLSLSAPARADITICNEFTAPIHVALAYENQGSFTAAGWWEVGPNACEPADFAFEGSKLYYAADSDDYRSGRFTKHDHWGNKTKLFVSKKKFNSENVERSRSGARAEMFSFVEVSQPTPEKPPKITFHFRSGGTTIEVKPSK
jgi:uncharacterized membrane protein